MTCKTIKIGFTQKVFSLNNKTNLLWNQTHLRYSSYSKIFFQTYHVYRYKIQYLFIKRYLQDVCKKKNKIELIVWSSDTILLYDIIICN